MEATLQLQSSLQKFIDHVEELRQEDDPSGDGFTREYRGLRELAIKMRDENTYPADEGRKPHNIRKNRYKDILPFDITRVTLDEIDGEEGSDYINANFIQDLHSNNCYIASQGPLPATVNDFWRMIWQYEVKVVTMACRLVEMGKKKCERYWPEKMGETEAYGDINVTLKEESHVGENCTRRRLQTECNGATRTVTQFHYTGWPDHDIPNDFDVILEMMAEMRCIRYQDPLKSPIVVHCSAGCGRTGTMCAIDYAWDVLKTGRLDESFSLYEIVKNMREERQSMIQAPEQYMMAHITVQQLFMKHLDLMEDHTYGNFTFQTEEPDQLGVPDADTVSESSSVGGQYMGRRKESLLDLEITSTLGHYSGVSFPTADSTPTAGSGSNTHTEPARDTSQQAPKMEAARVPLVPLVPSVVASKPALKTNVLQRSSSNDVSQRAPSQNVAQKVTAVDTSQDPTPDTSRDQPLVKSPLVKQMLSVFQVENIENIPKKRPDISQLPRKPSVDEKQTVTAREGMPRTVTAPPAGSVPATPGHVQILSTQTEGKHRTVLTIGSSSGATRPPLSASVSEPVSKSLPAREPARSQSVSSHKLTGSHVPPLAVHTETPADTTQQIESDYTSVGQSQFFTEKTKTAKTSTGQSNFYSTPQPEQPTESSIPLYAQVNKAWPPAQNGANTQQADSDYESVAVTRHGSQKAMVPPIPSRAYQEETVSQNSTESDKGVGEVNTLGKKTQLTNAIKNLFTGNKSATTSGSDHVVPSDIPGFNQRIGQRPAGPKPQPVFWSQKH